MAQLSPFTMIHTLDQWRRSAHENTALEEGDDNLGVVHLAWTMEERFDNDKGEYGLHDAGMAFDPWCRLYRCLPEAGQIERSQWATAGLEKAEPISLFSPEMNQLGDFNAIDNEDTAKGPLKKPVDVAVDRQGRLFIAEVGRQRLLIFDLVENKLMRQINFKYPPVKLATDGDKVWVLFADTGKKSTLAILNGYSEPVFTTLPEIISAPTAIAISQGQLYLISQGGTVQAQIIPLNNTDDAIAVPYAKDMVFVDDDILVVARRSSEDFLRFKLKQGAQTELPHLKARHYDGRGIVVTPDGDVAYWSEKGLLRATLARVRFEAKGKVTSFQLDSGEFQMQWGRLFIDACIPRGTSITAQFLCLDEIPETAKPLERTLPDNVIGITIDRPDLSPPMPPQELLSYQSATQIFHHRYNGRELPWQTCEDDNHFQTYETPIMAPPGRYLWVIVELTGTSRLTPKIKSLRAEYPSHDLLRRLPQLYSRELALADFLRRYLAMPEGELRDLDIRATYRHLLLDPDAAPAEVLPWLGGFMGMVVDKRWPERAKRQLIANGVWLFRFRGTVMGLKRFVEIYLDSSVTIIEHFKLRGLGGALLGENDALTSNSVLGSGFRIGGKLGEEQSESINDVSIGDAIKTHAHSFSLIIAASLNAEQQAVIEHLLETHRPAHTLYDICTVDAGMRIGTGLHAGLTSIVGQTSGFGQLQVGASLLGYTDTVGTAKMGMIAGGSRLGNDARVG